MRLRGAIAVASGGMLVAAVAAAGALGVATGMGFQPHDDSAITGTVYPRASIVESPLDEVQSAFPLPDRPLDDELRADDVPPTHADLEAYYAAVFPNEDDAWVDRLSRMQSLVVTCMAGAGYWYDPRYLHSNPTPGLWYRIDSPYGRAFEGETGGGDAYRWEDAGCWGYAAEHAGTGN